MKEFDFVKLTLWLAGLLTAALAVAWFVFGAKTQRVTQEIAQIQAACDRVGELAQDLKVLQNERLNDKAPQDSSVSGIHTYFSAQAQPCRINPNQDYVLKPRDPETNTRGGYVDQQFVIDFKKERPLRRDQLMKFIYNCESQSRRIKLQKARLTLTEENAPNDLWNADSLMFVRRDPSRGAGAAN